MATAHAIARRVEHVAEHRGRRRLAPGALAEPHQRSALGRPRRRRRSWRRAPTASGWSTGIIAGWTRRESPELADALGDAEQLDDVAGASRELDVDRAHAGDALARDRLAVRARCRRRARRGSAPWRRRRSPRRRRSGRPRRSRAPAPRSSALVVVAALARHLGEDEVGRPVDDAHHPIDPLAGERRAQRPQDRDAAADGGLVEEVGAVLVGQLARVRCRTRPSGPCWR